MSILLIIDFLICLVVLSIMALLGWAAMSVSSPDTRDSHTYHDSHHRTDNRTGERQHWKNGGWIDSDKPTS